MKKFYRDNVEISENDFTWYLESDSNDECDDDYVESMLNDSWQEVDVAGNSYPVGYALRQIDYMAFSQVQSEFQDARIGDMWYELGHEYDNDVEVAGHTYRITIEDDEEESIAVDWFNEEEE